MAELDIPGDDRMGVPSARVLVKNTFLDLDDVPRMPGLNRLRTAPARMDEDNGEGDDDLADAEDAADIGESPDPACPDMPGIYRQVTCDGFEPMNQWSWTQSHGGLDPASIIEGEPETIPEAPPPTPAGGQAPMPMMQPAPNCVMIVPSSMVPGQVTYMMPMMQAPMPVGFGTAENCPPGCVALPADAYGRWPIQWATQPGMSSGPSAASAAAAPGNSTAAAAPAAPQEPQERRIEPMMDNKAVTYNEMVTALAAQGNICHPGQLFQHWQGLQIAEEKKEVAPAPSSVGSGGYSAAPSAPLAPPAPALLSRAFSVNTGIFRIHWTVDARKLKSNDRVTVSPQFELDFFSVPVPFKMLIHPKIVSESKGGHSFRKAKGRGKVELKCEGVVDEGAGAMVTYRLLITSGKAGDKEKRTPPRGPVKHNFARGGVSGLKKEEEEWDFPQVVDDETQTFVVVLEILKS